VLGITILVIDYERNFGQAVVNSLGAGIGFMLAMIIFAGIREKMESSDIPKAFQGIPISLVSAALISMAFFGFQGIVEGLGLLG
jgi:electron transport complex protein RnfA